MDVVLSADTRNVGALGVNQRMHAGNSTQRPRLVHWVLLEDFCSRYDALEIGPHDIRDAVDAGVAPQVVYRNLIYGGDTNPV
jgi:hypothetical protein